MQIRPVSRNTLPDVIVEQIKTMIRDGALNPGDRIPGELELCERFQVGRTTVREALKALATLGLITRTREGTFVSKATADLLLQPVDSQLLLRRTTLENVFEARAVFEAEAAALAALRATAADLEAIGATLVDVDCTRPEAFREHDVRFHTAVANAAQNDVIRDVYIAVRDILFQTYHYYDFLDQHQAPAVAELLVDSVGDHRRIYQAIAARDEQEARRAVWEHVERVESRLLATGFLREPRLSGTPGPGMEDRRHRQKSKDEWEAT